MRTLLGPFSTLSMRSKHSVWHNAANITEGAVASKEFVESLFQYISDCRRGKMKEAEAVVHAKHISEGQE